MTEAYFQEEPLRKEKNKSKKKTGKKKAKKKGSAVRRKSSKSRRKKQLALRKTMGIIILLLLLSGCISALVWYFSFSNITLSDYLHLSYSGYSGRGSVHLTMEQDGDYAEFLEEVEPVLLSENGSLQNGEALQIRFRYDPALAKAHKLRISKEEAVPVVAGLAEGKTLTKEALFADLHLLYEGTAPELSVTLENKSTDPFFQEVTYTLAEEKDFYDLGDVITVTASVPSETAIQNHYIPPTEQVCTMEYPLTDLDRFLRETTELTPEHIHTLNGHAASLFGDANEYGLRIFSEANLMPIWVNGKTTFTWSNPRLISAYLNILRPEYFQPSQAHNNDVKLVYMATLSQADGVACDAEVVVQFTDLIRRSDGSYDLSLDSGRIIAASYHNSHIRDLVTDSYDINYEAKKLSLS